MNNVAKQRLDARLDFWFALNTKQQRELSSRGYNHVQPEDISYRDLGKVTKSVKVMKKWQHLQLLTGLYLVA